MRGQWGYIAISFVMGIAIACSSFQLVSVSVFGCYILFCIYRTSHQVLVFCIVTCASSYIYTSYVEWKNQPSKELNFEMTEGVIQTTPLINGDRLSFQIKVSNQDTLQLMYKIQSAEQKEQL
ncbi:DNA internalization-related competence protein ComEC/Rec2, partial [Bacillus pfraonensis]